LSHAPQLSLGDSHALVKFAVQKEWGWVGSVTKGGSSPSDLASLGSIPISVTRQGLDLEDLNICKPPPAIAQVVSR
jgi:hypothetical protein